MTRAVSRVGAAGEQSISSMGVRAKYRAVRIASRAPSSVSQELRLQSGALRSKSMELSPCLTKKTRFMATDAL